MLCRWTSACDIKLVILDNGSRKMWFKLWYDILFSFLLQILGGRSLMKKTTPESLNILCGYSHHRKARGCESISSQDGRAPGDIVLQY